MLVSRHFDLLFLVGIAAGIVENLFSRKRNPYSVSGCVICIHKVVHELFEFFKIHNLFLIFLKIF